MATFANEGPVTNDGTICRNVPNNWTSNQKLVYLIIDSIRVKIERIVLINILCVYGFTSLHAKYQEYLNVI